MDLLIKNMEMPKSCLGELDGKNDCPIVGICEIFKATPFKEKENIVWNQRLKDCPLVELPPHGELIDRLELLKHRFEVYDSNEEVCEDYVETYHILEAPVVLEAST